MKITKCFIEIYIDYTREHKLAAPALDLVPYLPDIFLKIMNQLKVFFKNSEILEIPWRSGG